MDCTYANNVIVAKNPPIVRFQDLPIRTTWMGNFFFGAETGMDPNDGVLATDPKLVRGPDNVWRPAAGSPVIGAARGDFPFVTDDIEGRSRGTGKDAGCFQSAGEAKRRPMTPRDVGPEWMLSPSRTGRGPG